MSCVIFVGLLDLPMGLNSVDRKTRSASVLQAASSTFRGALERRRRAHLQS